MEAATVETMEENTAEQSEDVTTSPIFQDHERRDLETQIVSVSVKVAATHKQPQSSIPKHSYPNTSTHLPSLTHTCGTHKAAR